MSLHEGKKEDKNDKKNLKKLREMKSNVSIKEKRRGSASSAEPRRNETLKKEGTMGSNHEQGNATHSKTTKIPRRNVNLYRHLIDGFASTDDEIDWVLKLRTANGELAEKLSRIPNATFNVYDKKLEGSKVTKETEDLGWKGDSGSLNHLINHRIGPTAHGSLVAFETNLRSTGTKLREREKGWSSIPFKDRREFPSFLPPLKDELRMTSEAKISGEKLKIKREPGLQGHLDYPGYTFKVHTRNVNDMRHLHYSGNFQSAIDFDTGLRFYEKEDAKFKKREQNQVGDSAKGTKKIGKEAKEGNITSPKKG